MNLLFIISNSYCHKLKAQVKVWTLLLLIPMTGQSQIPVQDSLDLVNFYEITNGQNWTHNDNWLTGPIYTWYGIMVENYTTVRYISLDNNNLTGSISNSFQNLQSLFAATFLWNNITGTLPATFGTMQELNGINLGCNHFIGPLPETFGNPTILLSLELDSNEFSGTFPDTILKRPGPFLLWFSDNNIDSLPYNPDYFGWLDVRGNKLSFDDVIPYLSNQNLVFDYSPQDSILSSIDTTVLINSNLTLDSWIDTCAHNKYRWKKNGVFLTPQAGFSSTWSINPVQYADSGYYSCDVSNADAPLLVLHRNLIHVRVSDGATIPPIERDQTPFKLTFSQPDNFLNIQFNFSRKKDVDCQLINITGQRLIILYSGKVMSEELHYYLSWLKPGIYMVRTIIDNKPFTRKIIIN